MSNDMFNHQQKEPTSMNLKMGPRTTCSSYYLAICAENGDVMSDPKMAIKIKEEIENMMNCALNAGVDYEALWFNSFAMVPEGFILVEAANQKSMKWLLNNKKVQFSCFEDHCCAGLKFKIIRLESQITIKIDTPYTDSLFKHQNQHLQHLKINQWEALVRKNNELMFNIPEDVAAVLDKTVTLYYGFSMVGPTLQHLPTNKFKNIYIA